jgi:hypothetical protein
MIEILHLSGQGFLILYFYGGSITGISWRSDLLVEETAVPGENH